MTAAAKPPTVSQAVAAVMADVAAIGKTRRNQQQGFMFRSIEDIFDMLHPVLVRHGVWLSPHVVDERFETRTSDKGKTANVTLVKVRFLAHGPAGDEAILAEVWGEGADLADKATAKAHSMAAKTALVQALSIPTQDLEDADAGGEAAARLDAQRMRDEQAEATRTRNAGNAGDERTGRDLLRELHLSAGDAMKQLKGNSSAFRGITIKTLLEATGERLRRIEAHLRAALDQAAGGEAAAEDGA